METLPQTLPQTVQQPIIVKTGGGISAGGVIAGVAALAVGGYFFHNWWVKHKAQGEAGKLDTPAAQAASKIESAKHWYGDKPQIAFDAAKEIVQNKVSWKDVSEAFKNLYNKNIDDYLDFLSPEEHTQFFNILNLSHPVAAGQPPAKSSMKYDVVKNMVYAVATKGTNIRKSPAIIGNGGYTSMVGDSNIVGTAAINQPLGLMTGEYKLSPDGKTGLVEFFALSFDGNQSKEFKRVWVSGANIKTVQFSRATQIAEAKKYEDGSNFIHININKYNDAIS